MKRKSLNLHPLHLQNYLSSSPHIFHFLSPLPDSHSLLSLLVYELTWQSNPLTVADNAGWLCLLAAIVDWMDEAQCCHVR